jgi:hypothetical protein
MVLLVELPKAPQRIVVVAQRRRLYMRELRLNVTFCGSKHAGKILLQQVNGYRQKDDVLHEERDVAGLGQLSRSCQYGQRENRNNRERFHASLRPRQRFRAIGWIRQKMNILQIVTL